LVCIAFGAIVQNINWRKSPVQPAAKLKKVEGQETW
jgi:hypothetical protein